MRVDQSVTAIGFASVQVGARARRPRIVLLAAASVLVSAAHAQPSFHFTELGFTGPDYRSLGGYRDTQAYYLNEAGDVAGTSERFHPVGGFGNGYDAWLYDGTDTVQVGFTGTGYEGSDGYRLSFLYRLNAAGQVQGISERFHPVSGIGNGYDAWLYDGTDTVQVGFTGAGYEDLQGYRRSSPELLNEAGQIAGVSARFDPVSGADLGLDAWLYAGGATSQVGMTGSGYEDSSGYRRTDLLDLNEAGQVAGGSHRYSGTADHGRDAWLYNGVGTVQVGFTGTQYEDPNGYRESVAVHLNETGHLAGYSRRFDALNGDELGADAWLYAAGSTLRIGLTGSGYEDAQGNRNSSPSALNQAGQVVGVSERHDPRDFFLNRGSDAWLFTPTGTDPGTVRIGFTGTGYEGLNGYRESAAWLLNEAGQAAGISERFDPVSGNGMGEDAWFYTSGHTVQVGLIGAGYEDQFGSRWSMPEALNAAGQIVGYSARNNATNTGTIGGSDAWLYNGTVTVQVGLTGKGYEDFWGYRESRAEYLNEVGQVAGYSKRYRGKREVGQAAWFYDAARDTTFEFAFWTDQFRSGSSEVEFLDDAGIALGTFELFDRSTQASLGNRAFYFSFADCKAYVLDELVVEDITVEGWDHLASAIRGNSLGQIIGYSLLPAGGRGAYLLTPTAVPVAGTVWLLGPLLLGFSAWGRVRRRSGGGPLRRFWLL